MARPKDKKANKRRASGGTSPNGQAFTPAWIGPSFLFLAVFAIVDHIPQFKAVDVMGAQWLYLAILNMCALGWLVARRVLRPDGAFRSLLFLAILTLVLLALLSFTVAFNQVESLVTFSRLWITFTAVICVFTLLREKPEALVPTLALLAISAVVRSGTVWSELVENVGKYESLDDIIYFIRGNSGNKNILAATLAVKLPMLVFFAHRTRGLVRVLSFAGFTLVVVAILIVNARTAYLSTAFIALGAMVWPFLARDGHPLRTKAKRMATVAGCAALAFGASQLLFKSLERKKQVKQYGAVTERLASITVSNDASSGRLKLWAYALDFIGRHPVRGGGYGNWKIHSIPYEKHDLNGFGCRKHAHNDFLELTAETGIPGGMAYLLVFAGALVLIGRRFLSVQHIPNEALLAYCLALAWAAYGLDALLNFPTERANMQAVFALITGVPLLWARRAGLSLGASWAPWTLGGVMLVTGAGAVWVSWQAYLSMAVQNRIAAEWFGKPDTSKSLRVNADDLAASFPAIPNISEVCMPISCMKAKYFAEAKRYPEALALLERTAEENPHLGYDLFMRGMIALNQRQLDSALHYADLATHLRPANHQIYRFKATVGVERKDTSLLRSAFDAVLPFYHAPEVWREFAQNMLALRASPASITAIADSGLVRFPDDKGLLFIKHFNQGLSLFNQQRYAESIPEFEAALPNAEGLGSAAASGRKLCLDDLGFSSLNIGDYARSKYWLDASVAQNANDPKVRYYRGVVSEQLGDLATACADFQAAAQYGHPVEEVRLARCR
ncbi:MAG: O-antigen ligase family protein [Flavobacteriales bacterium]|nr:O-antigen ligase family protein [Flavobacteriales bacterium]